MLSSALKNQHFQVSAMCICREIIAVAIFEV